LKSWRKKSSTQHARSEEENKAGKQTQKPKGKPLSKVHGMNERNNGEKNRIEEKERPNG
jgi:hypothetical protein